MTMLSPTEAPIETIAEYESAKAFLAAILASTDSRGYPAWPVFSELSQDARNRVLVAVAQSVERIFA